MIGDVRLHGRGGQGVVTAAQLLAIAAFLDGHEAQAFPRFGSERMGAPVESFVRVSDTPIRLREPVSRPDGVAVFDATLLHHEDVFAGLADDGWAVLNSASSPDRLGLQPLMDRLPRHRVRTVPADDLARRHLGRRMPNVIVLAALAELTGIVSAQSLDSAVRRRFPAEVAEANIQAADAVRRLVGAHVDA